MVKENHKKHHGHHHNRVEGSGRKESTGSGLKMVLKAGSHGGEGHKHHKHHKHRHHHKGQKRLKHAANVELKSIKNEVEDSQVTNLNPTPHQGLLGLTPDYLKSY